MERAFGESFADVQLHTGSVAAEQAAAHSADAFTSGEHVVFGAGQYAPGSTSGRTLLAHELAHVVQQRRAAHGRLPASAATADVEHDADRAAAAASTGDVAQPALGSRLQIMRQPIRKDTGPVPAKGGVPWGDAPVASSDSVFLPVFKSGMIGMISQDALNNSARQVVAFIRDKVKPTGEQFDVHYQNLTATSSDIGPRDLKAATSPRAIAQLEKKTEGPKGDRLRGKVKDFVDSHGELAKALELYAQAKLAFEAATDKVQIATLVKEELEDERETAEAKEAVEARKKTVEQQLDYVNEAIDIGKTLFGGPEKLFDAGLDVLSFATKQMAKAALMNDIGLYEAQQRLTAAEKKLGGVQDKKVALGIGAAAKEASAAGHGAAAAWLAVTAAAKKGAQAQATLTATLNATGLTGMGKAMADRQWVLGEASQAIQLLAKYEHYVDPLGKSAKNLESAYRHLAEFVSMPAGQARVPDANVRAELIERCRRNAGAAEDLGTWQRNEMANIARLRKEIAAAEWLQPYDQIDTALEHVLEGGPSAASKTPAPVGAAVP